MPQVNPNYNPNPAPKPRAHGNSSVPPGHRTKCRKCGCTDNVCIVGHNRRLRVCGACGGSVALRRAPKQPRVISFVVVRQLNGVSYGDLACVDRFMAEREALTFVERGPVARSRVSMIVELLDDHSTGSYHVLSYSNYKQRRQDIRWSSGCETCKGRGLLGVVVRVATAEEKAVRGFVACSTCSGLGGELSRKVMLGRAIK